MTAIEAPNAIQAGNYLSGTPEAVEAFHAHLNMVHDLGGVALVGSVARTAMYSEYGWTGGKPLEMEYYTPPTAVERIEEGVGPEPILRRRDTDFLASKEVREEVRGLETKHHMDPGLSGHIEYDPDTGVYGLIAYDGKFFPIDKKVFETRTYNLDGSPVRSFKAGTLHEINKLLAHPSKETDADPKYKRNIAEFDVFLKAMSHDRKFRREHFLPKRYYEPFRKYQEYTYGQLPKTKTGWRRWLGR